MGIAKTRRQGGIGFTLVELLIVIAIIGVLVALGLPALNRSIRAANQAKCTANLRQIGVLCAGYASDHDGKTVPAWDMDRMWNFGESLIDWKGSKLDSNYTINGGFENWRCPENRKQIHPSGSEGGEGAGSYGINGWGGIWPTPANPEPEARENRYSGNRVVNFTSPSKLYAVVEAAGTRTEPWKNNGESIVPAGLFSTGVPTIRYAHDKKVNVLFADGHGELLPGPLLGRGTYQGGDSSKAAAWSNGEAWFAN